MAQQLTPTHRHLTVLARQLASGLACLVFQCKWSLCLGLPIVELHAQFNISHKENHNKTTYNQWYISCFLVRERLFLSSNLTWESQGCLRVTLQQILVPRGGDHFVQRHECSWCKESWPSARNKKKWPFSSPEPIVLFGHVVLKPSGSGDENENCPTPWHVIRMSSVRYVTQA